MGGISYSVNKMCLKMGAQVKKFFMFLSVILLAGCAHPAVVKLRQLDQQALPLVQSGQMLPSQYYRQAYQIMLGLPNTPDKPRALKIAEYAIDSSLAAEAQQISPAEYERRIRQVSTALAALQASASQRRKDESAEFWASIAATAQAQRVSQSQTVIIQQQPAIRPPINCTTSTFGSSLNTTCW